MEKTILVVDDNPDLIYTVKAALRQKEDYRVTSAGGGTECLKLLEDERPDLVLLDIMMPNMDGWDVAARMKTGEGTKDIPIIFLTAKTDDLSRGMGSLTSEDYIEKPFTADDLVARIERVLERG